MNLLDSLNITLLNIGKASLGKNWNYDNVISPFSRLYLITEGAAQVHHHQKIFHLQPGYLYLIPSYVYSRYVCESSHTQYYISFLEECGNGLSAFDMHEFYYQKQALAEDQALFERLLELNPNRYYTNDNPQIYDNLPTLLKFKSLNDALSPKDYLETKGIITVLFSRFIKHVKPGLSETTSIQTRITSSLKYIRLNLHKDLTVTELAERAHLNSDYFSRLFLNVMGVRPLRYSQLCRIERAQLLLATTTNTLEEIAQKIGINNQSYFNRLFKQITQKTPGEYRKEVWKV